MAATYCPFVKRCATIVSLTQLAEENGALDDAELLGAQGLLPAAQAMATSKEVAVKECEGLPLVTYQYPEHSNTRLQHKSSLQKQNSGDTAVVPEFYDDSDAGTCSSPSSLSDGASEFTTSPMYTKDPHHIMQQAAYPAAPTEQLGAVPQVSGLDSAIISLWDACAAEGLFRYDVTACPSKVLPGRLNFMAQYNEGRATKKRPTEFRIDQVVQPFDNTKFNFKKAQMREVLMQFQPVSVPASSSASHARLLPAAPAGASPHLVLINISPIDYAHVLLVPRVNDDLPQLVDSETMGLAIAFARETGNPYFRVGYNSLGAYATINHLHFQAYYLPTNMACEEASYAPLKALIVSAADGCVLAATDAAATKRKRDAVAVNGDDASAAPGTAVVRVGVLTDYPVRGWVLEADVSAPGAAGAAAASALAAVVGTACQRMAAANIPHNLIIVNSGAKVLLWPQCFAERVATGQVPERILDTGVNPAVFETSGHMLFKRAEDYEGASSEGAIELLSYASLTQERFDAATKLCFGDYCS